MVVPLLAHQFESFFAFIDGKYLALKASAKWRQREEEEEETVESLNPPLRRKKKGKREREEARKEVKVVKRRTKEEARNPCMVEEEPSNPTQPNPSQTSLFVRSNLIAICIE